MTQPAIQFPIVKPFLPCSEQYHRLISDVFKRNWLTNNGPLVQELEQRLALYLGVKHLMLVANGTLALQVAYAALGIKDKVITTPFSFAATASSLCWDNIRPVFADIDPQSLNIDPDKAEALMDEEVSAILAVHVFGNPCDVNALDKLAVQHNVKLVYDAAHAFATKYHANEKDECSVLNYGDASTLSLHATKLFHSVEGGAIIFKNKVDLDKAKQLINFGFDNNNYPKFVGVNAKMSEVHAAMGLAVLDNIEYIEAQRKRLADTYQKLLTDVVELQVWAEMSDNVGAYQPILLASEHQLQFVSNYLIEQGVQTRRYFYPSLSTVTAYGMQGETPIANDISERVLCLPMYTDLQPDDITHICLTLKQALLAYTHVEQLKHSGN